MTFFLLMGGFWLILSFVVNPVIRAVTTEEIRALAVSAVNNAASDVMANQINYADLLQITKDNDGNIALIQANTVLINQIARQTTLKSQENISKLGEQGISIPVGSLSGISFLSGRGPVVKLRALPVGSVDTQFRSEFIGSGINQTRHKIYLSIGASITIVIPGLNNTIYTEEELMICESIIVGKIPDVYLESNRLDKLLNLVP